MNWLIPKHCLLHDKQTEYFTWKKIIMSLSDLLKILLFKLTVMGTLNNEVSEDGSFFKIHRISDLLVHFSNIHEGYIISAASYLYKIWFLWSFSRISVDMAVMLFN